MLRKLARLTAVACAFLASQALALGLGDINVKSKLNQRFSATIPVLGATQAQLDGLTVRLAGSDEFNRAGIERSDYLSTLKFDIQAVPGGGRVVVSSDQIAREPFLNFIVEARSPDGKLLREYTVLLDPPTLAESETPVAAPAPAAAAPAPAPPPVAAAPAPSEPAPQAAAPEAQAPAPTSPAAAAPAAAAKHGKGKGKAKAPATAVAAAPAPEAPAAEPAAAPAPAPAESAAAGATYGPTAPQETLWSIATKLRPGPQVTMDQVLLAIYRSNPAAFEKGSFNGLFKGQVLHVPSLADMQATPPAEAKDAVDAWRHGSSPVAAAAVKKNNPEVAAAEAAPVEKPKPAKPAKSAKPSAEAKPEAPAPIAVAPAPTPTPAAAPPAAKPSTPAASAPAPAPSATPPPSQTSAAATAPSEAAKGPATAPAQAPSAAQPAATPATPAASAAPAATLAAPAAGSTPPAKKPLAPPPPPPGLFEDTNTQLAVGAVAVLLIAAFGWFIFRRRKEAVPDFRAKAPAPKMTLGPLPAKKNGAPAPLPSKPGLAAATLEEAPAAFAPLAEPLLAETETALDDTGQFKAAETALSDAETKAKPVGGGGNLDFDLTSQFEAQTVSINMDANDPLSEADFHLAYGLYDEAAALLKQALQKEPQRQDLRIKLAETYFAAGKPVEFQETAEALHGHLNAADWQKIAIMGRQLCPDAGLFKGESEAATPDFDLSLGDMSLTPAPVVGHETAPVPAAKPEHVIDFDLDSELLKAGPSGSGPTAAAPAAGAGKPDFDLSHFDFGAEPHAPAGGDSIEFNLDELDLTKPAGSIASGDEIGTKLDLARVYADMGDNEAARGLLNEVLATGNSTQKGEAEALIKRLSA